MSEKPLLNLRILVAEDNADMWLLTRHHLVKAGALVYRAENGLEALKLASKDEFCAIVMDIQMPIMDGLQAAKELRDQGFEKPILAFTAHSHRHDDESSYNSGCDEHFTKPTDLSTLVQTLAFYCTGSGEK